MTCRIPVSALVAGLVTSLLASVAVADPAFDYKSKKEAGLEEVKSVEWKAAAQAGVIQTTGNSELTTFTSALTSSRKEGNNKFALDASVAYAKQTILIASDDNADGAIDSSEVQESTATSTKAWGLKARYDRFLTTHNSLYLAGLASGDRPAGKEFVGGGQLGYSRQLYKDAQHEAVAEIGYDFSYEDLVVGDAQSIHSARFFVGYLGALTKDTGLTGSVEFLTNVNELDSGVDPMKDRRTTAILGLTTKLFDDLSFRFGFTAKHDSAPAPRPPFAIPYAAGYLPLAHKLDTKTEATLIYNFL